METAVKTNTLKDKIVSEFESSKGALFGGLKLREEALESFLKQGIPNRKSEEYKYVNVELMLKGEFSFESTKTISAKQIEHTKFIKDAIDVVIVNGVFSNDLSNIKFLPKGVTILNMADATANEVFQKHFSKYAEINADAFIALNTALANGGVFIHVAKGAIIEAPIHIINISKTAKNTIIHSRNLIVEAADSSGDSRMP